MPLRTVVAQEDVFQPPVGAYAAAAGRANGLDGRVRFIKNLQDAASIGNSWRMGDDRGGSA